MPKTAVRIPPRVRATPLPHPHSGALATPAVPTLEDRKRPGHPPEGAKVCNQCHKELRGQGGACGRCKRVRYCSTDCQKKDWGEGHKKLCTPKDAPAGQ